MHHAVVIACAEARLTVRLSSERVKKRTAASELFANRKTPQKINP
jgi:hypothetical protein